MRVLLDTNVWLAILTTDGFCREIWRRSRRDCQFYGSRGLLDELEEKLRSKFGFVFERSFASLRMTKRTMELLKETAVA